MKLKIGFLALAVMLLGAVTLAPLSAAQAAAPQRQAVAIPVTGSGQNVNFNGTANVTRFIVQNGQVQAVGTLTGTVTDAAGTVLGTVSNVPFQSPIANAQAGCQILNLVLGPLDLNLLGLTVHLNQVVLDITAVPGAGNLLGNLLCAVANLLNGGGNLNALSTLLNNVLRILSGL